VVYVGTLSFALLVLIFPIGRLREPEALAAAIASYFFSAMSLRSIVSEEMHMFPTLFDCWILTVSAVMLLRLIYRVWQPQPESAGLRRRHH